MMQITKITNTSKVVSTTTQADKLVALSFTVAEMQNAQARQEAKLNLVMLISLISLITSVAALALSVV